MMKHEFETLAGYEVSTEDYNKIIEPMYMATGLDKQDFVKCISKQRFALPTKNQMMRKMKRIAEYLEGICGHALDYDAEHELEAIAKEYAERFYGIDWARDMESYVFFSNAYEFPEIKRGCTYPAELVIGRTGARRFEVRISLVDERITKLRGCSDA